MVDYEKGTPAWDIGMILTRHADGLHKGQNGKVMSCARVISLRRTAHSPMTSSERLAGALAHVCDCGAGDSDAERSSIIRAERIATATIDQEASNDVMPDVPSAGGRTTLNGHRL
jgi:hypothetical protein